MMATTRQSSIQSSVLSPPDRSYIRDPFASVVPDNSMKIVTPNGLTSPPALPARKVTTTSSSSLFPHPYTPPPHSAPPEISIVEPKPIRAGLRPPPKRSITLGEKLPPARRPPSETSSESEDEDSKGKLDSLPLADRASRRPPLFQSYNLSNFKIHVPAHDGLATVSGDIVIVAAPHRLKIYDISQSDSPIHSLDTKRLCADHRIQDFKVSAIEFISPSVSPGKSYVWLGCKEGHLIEVDALVGRISSIKYAAHTGTVSHIFRYRSNMVTVDVHGKALVFSLGSGVGHGSGLVDLNPQVLRIAEKPAFVKMLGKQLWVASHSSDSLGPSTIKTYNLFSSTFGVGYPVACDRLTPVLSGTIIPSQEDRVYLGHVGGFISVFSLSPDGKPTLQETIKISASDVLSLEGVNTRLWAGGRNGNIMVFDVDVKPWRVTNCWMAHVNVPVLRLAVDTKSILDLKRLPVYSIGRDEQLRFWDGLLGADWIGKNLYTSLRATS